MIPDVPVMADPGEARVDLALTGFRTLTGLTGVARAARFFSPRGSPPA